MKCDALFHRLRVKARTVCTSQPVDATNNRWYIWLDRLEKSSRLRLGPELMAEMKSDAYGRRFYRAALCMKAHRLSAGCHWLIDAHIWPLEGNVSIALTWNAFQSHHQPHIEVGHESSMAWFKRMSLSTRQTVDFSPGKEMNRFYQNLIELHRFRGRSNRPAMDETGAPTSVSLTSSTTVDNASLMEANSSGDVMLDLSIYLRFASNRRVHDAAFYSLISAYSLLMVIGAAGNLLVVYAVVRQPAMRTVRNVFIINLAVSDLLLCVVTMPLTMMEVLSNTWQLGNSPFLCKMVGSLQAISIFVSTMSIAAIALDRYQLIVYPTQSSCQKAGALTALVTIWIARLVHFHLTKKQVVNSI